MKRTLPLLASMAFATLLTRVVVLVAPKEQSRAAFPGVKGKIVFVREGARDSHTFTIRALKDWKRDATAGLLDAPRINLEAEAEISLLSILVCWMYSRSARSAPA
jgi:hypothetical protein